MALTDKIVFVLSTLLVLSIVVYIVTTGKQNSNQSTTFYTKNIGGYKANHPLKGYSRKKVKVVPFRQHQKAAIPLIGFNTNNVPLATMPPYIKTPREYFNTLKTGAAAVLPTDIETVENALSQGDYGIATGGIRVPFGTMRNKLYRSWGSTQLSNQTSNLKFKYKKTKKMNVDSPSFQCGNFLPRQGGLQQAKRICSTTPSCTAIITDKNNIPICLKSSSEQQRFYKDSGVNYFEKQLK